MIGALACVGLASTGEDGRFVLVERSRELDGKQTVQAILGCGIVQVRTTSGEVLTEGVVETSGKLRPALRSGKPILFVTRQDGDPAVWLPVKLD